MYTWLSLIEAETKGQGASATSQMTIDGRAYLLNEAIPSVEARINNYCSQEFAPYIETRPYDATRNYIDWYKNQLILDRPLLEATTVKVADVTLTQWNGVYADRYTCDYSLYPYQRSPALALQGMQQRAAWQPYTYNAAYGGPAVAMGAITVTGVWGFRRRYPAEGWTASTQTVQDDPLSSGGTSITVDSAAVFSPGMLLLIEDEYLSVTAVDTETNTLTVVRGVRGSTAAEHAQNTAISIWYAEDAIIRAATRWCAYLYHKRAVYQTVTVETPTGIASQLPSDMPTEIANTLAQYVNVQGARA